MPDKAKIARNNKARGKDWERSVVKLLKGCGFDAHRTWGSTGASEGLEPDVDVVATLSESATTHYQCKSLARISKELIPGPHLSGVFVKTKKNKLVVIDMEYFLWLLWAVFKRGKNEA